MPVTALEKNGAFKHCRSVAWRQVADEAVILNVDTVVYYSLRGAGLRMWELLGDGKSASDIARILTQEYEASEDGIRKDCADLICKLRKESLVEPA